MAKKKSPAPKPVKWVDRPTPREGECLGDCPHNCPCGCKGGTDCPHPMPCGFEGHRNPPMAGAREASRGSFDNRAAQHIHDRLVAVGWNPGTASDILGALRAFDGAVYTYANVGVITDLAAIFRGMGANPETAFGTPPDGRR